MRTLIKFLPLVVLLIASCKETGTGKDGEGLSREERFRRDSVSRENQRQRADSLKKTNPLLIVPPDSMYTGSYVDKYPTGITKFVGFFRFGQRHGQWLSFYPNGLAWSEMHYDKGLRHGPNMTYYPDGKMRFSGFYKLDKKDSVWCYYDSLGKPMEKLLFKNDKLVKQLPLN